MKRSLRDYLLTLVLAVVIFSVAAVFLIEAAEGLMKDVVTKIGSEGEIEQETVTSEQASVSEPETKDTSEQKEEVKEDVFSTFLLLGLDEKKEKLDSIFLIGLNATKKQATVALIPCNTSVADNGEKKFLGDLYSSRNINFYKEFVQTETGIMPDYYAVYTTSALANLIDLWGGISFKVPQEIKVEDKENKIKIDLAAGQQTLNGSQSVQLLRYNNFNGGRAAKEDTQLNFFKTFCTNYMTAENLSRAPAIHNNMYYNCQTDFEEADLKELGEMIFAMTTYKQSYVRIPGASSGNYYNISSTKAKAMFEIYQ
ncbi:MAG: LCP family protein [Clostridia bacterium]|nr:LCP family protein [Clostridia bacterium]